MFRKIGYIILSALLILTTVGFNISRHYCGDKLVAVSIDLPTEPCCNDMENECCHDDNMLVIFKVDFTKPVAGELSISDLDLFGTLNKELVNEYANFYLPANIITDPSPPPGTHLFLAKIQSYLL
nr:hypothetical protein [Bacteroidota bacterium]